MKIADLNFVPFIYTTEIRQIVNGVAEKLNQDYADTAEPVYLVTVLNGAMPFAVDLMRKLKFPVIVDTVRASSYRGGTKAGKLEIEKWVEFNPKDKNVLLVEDIVDTGQTIAQLRSMFAAEKPASLKVCTFLFKPDAFLGYTADETPEYVGLSIPNEFVVGYGLDYKDLGRNLDKVYKLD